MLSRQSELLDQLREYLPNEAVDILRQVLGGSEPALIHDGPVTFEFANPAGGEETEAQAINLPDGAIMRARGSVYGAAQWGKVVKVTTAMDPRTGNTVVHAACRRAENYSGQRLADGRVDVVVIGAVDGDVAVGEVLPYWYDAEGVRFSVRGSQMGRPLLFRCTQDVPPYGIMTVAPYHAEVDGVAILMTKPALVSGGDQYFVVNGPDEYISSPDGEPGQCYILGDYPGWVAVGASDVPEPGEVWGPVAGQWTIGRGVSGFVVLRFDPVTDGTPRRALVIRSVGDHLRKAVLRETLNAGGTAAARLFGLYRGAAGVTATEVTVSDEFGVLSAGSFVTAGTAIGVEYMAHSASWVLLAARPVQSQQLSVLVCDPSEVGTRHCFPQKLLQFAPGILAACTAPTVCLEQCCTSCSPTVCESESDQWSWESIGCRWTQQTFNCASFMDCVAQFPSECGDCSDTSSGVECDVSWIPCGCSASSSDCNCCDEGDCSGTATYVWGDTDCDWSLTDNTCPSEPYACWPCKPTWKGAYDGQEYPAPCKCDCPDPITFSCSSSGCGEANCYGGDTWEWDAYGCTWTRITSWCGNTAYGYDPDCEACPPLTQGASHGQQVLESCGCGCSAQPTFSCDSSCSAGDCGTATWRWDEYSNPCGWGMIANSCTGLCTPCAPDSRGTHNEEVEKACECECNPSSWDCSYSSSEVNACVGFCEYYCTDLGSGSFDWVKANDPCPSECCCDGPDTPCGSNNASAAAYTECHNPPCSSAGSEFSSSSEESSSESSTCQAGNCGGTVMFTWSTGTCDWTTEQTCDSSPFPCTACKPTWEGYDGQQVEVGCECSPAGGCSDGAFSCSSSASCDAGNCTGGQDTWQWSEAACAWTRTTFWCDNPEFYHPDCQPCPPTAAGTYDGEYTNAPCGCSCDGQSFSCDSSSSCGGNCIYTCTEVDSGVYAWQMTQGCPDGCGCGFPYEDCNQWNVGQQNGEACF